MSKLPPIVLWEGFEGIVMTAAEGQALEGGIESLIGRTARDEDGEIMGTIERVWIDGENVMASGPPRQ